jgi:hypothetical protein
VKERETEKMGFTLLSSRARARCWAPSAQIPFRPISSVVSAYIAQLRFKVKKNEIVRPTVLFSSTRARCWAPSTLSSLDLRFNVLSVCVRMSRCKNWKGRKYGIHRIIFESVRQILRPFSANSIPFQVECRKCLCAKVKM